MRRLTKPAAALTLVLAGALLGTDGAGASPTCEGYKDVANHGEHVITDYVLGAVVGGDLLESWPPTAIGETVSEQGGALLPGGPGPAWHGEHGAPPGASFCIAQAHSGGRG